MVIWVAPVLHPRIWLSWLSPWVPLEFLVRKNVCWLIYKRSWNSLSLDVLLCVSVVGVDVVVVVVVVVVVAGFERNFVLQLRRALSGIVARVGSGFRSGF